MTVGGGRGETGGTAMTTSIRLWAMLGLLGFALTAHAQIDAEIEKQRVDKLLKDLKAEKEEDRVNAAQELAGLTLTKETAKPLVEALKDESLAVRGWASIALLRADQTQAKLAFTTLGPLFDKSELVLSHVSWALAFQHIKPTKKETVTGLLKLARQKNSSAMTAGLFGLDNLGPDAREAVEVIEDALEDKNAQIRLRCALGLGRIDSARMPKVQPILDAGLKEQDVEDRLFAAEAIVDLDPRQKAKVIAAIAPGMRVPDGKSRLRIATVILDIDPDQTKFVLPFLTSSLKDKDKEIRQRALTLIAERGVGAASTENTLRDLIKDKGEDPEVAADACEALMRIRPERAGDFFTSLVELRDKQGKTDIAGLLEVIEKQDDIVAKQDPKELPRTIIKRIETKVERKNGYLIQLSAVVKMSTLGQRSKEAVPALIALLQDSRPVMNALAAHWLGKQGNDARNATQGLYDVYRGSPSADVRIAAARALWQVNPSEAKKANVLDVDGVDKKKD